jgi:hypothetical protein
MKEMRRDNRKKPLPCMKPAHRGNQAVEQVRIFAMLMAILLVMIHITPGFGETFRGIEIAETHPNAYHRFQAPQVQGLVSPRARGFARAEVLEEMQLGLLEHSTEDPVCKPRPGPNSPWTTKALWIEAEEESAFHISSSCSGERSVLPHFGESYWALGGEGDWVEYSIDIPKEQLYYIWVRHFYGRDECLPPGTLRISMNGISMTTLPDHRGPKKNSWSWARVGWGHMSKERHALRITKIDANQAPALIDAVLIIPNGEVKPPGRKFEQNMVSGSN